ncbi:hypothetical protein D3C86_1937370 [compost metagenome]
MPLDLHHGRRPRTEIGEDTDTGSGGYRSSQRTGFARAGNGDGNAEHIGKDLRPDQAARPASGEDRLVEHRPCLPERFDMGTVAEGDAFE